jgi:hypothetical protein
LSATAAAGLVVGTDHATEAVTGFFTKYGDGAADLFPLAGLTKRRVRHIARLLGAPPAMVAKAPSPWRIWKVCDRADPTRTHSAFPIKARFVVTVAEQPATTFGVRGISAGQATRCYRYVLQLYRYTEHYEIDCPTSTAIPAPPTASPVPRMPDDARERLSAVLRTATLDTLAAAVRAAFPENYISIDTATHNGASNGRCAGPGSRASVQVDPPRDGRHAVVLDREHHVVPLLGE